MASHSEKKKLKDSMESMKPKLKDVSTSLKKDEHSTKKST